MHSLVYPAIPLALGGIAPNQQGFEHFSIDSNAIERPSDCFGQFWFVHSLPKVHVGGRPMSFHPAKFKRCIWGVIKPNKELPVFYSGHGLTWIWQWQRASASRALAFTRPSGRAATHEPQDFTPSLVHIKQPQMLWFSREFHIFFWTIERGYLMWTEKGSDTCIDGVHSSPIWQD